MEKMQFTTSIHAPVAKVYDLMLGKETYRQWTAAFNPTSDFEGSWEKGKKILFVGTSKEGKREGMVGMIRENTPRQFVSIEYVGLVDGDKEMTEGPGLEGWTGAFENYTFNQENGTTKVTVDLDVNSEWVGYFKETYPKALDKLKAICEA